MMHHPFGDEKYLNDDGKVLLPIVKKKVQMSKDKGLNPIYCKSRWWQPDIIEELAKENPTHELIHKELGYRQQLVTRCLKVCGFRNRGRHTSRPTLVLEW
jgi:hypothetical protein